MRQELGEACLRFDVYGRYQLEEGHHEWRALGKIYRLGVGKACTRGQLGNPSLRHNRMSRLEMWLDDLFHELAEPGRTIRQRWVAGETALTSSWCGRAGQAACPLQPP